MSSCRSVVAVAVEGDCGTVMKSANRLQRAEEDCDQPSGASNKSAQYPSRLPV